MYVGMMHAHSGLAYLWLVNCALSVLIAMGAMALGPKPALLKAGKVVGRILEHILGGLVGLLGIVLTFVSPTSGWTDGFVLLGLLAVVLSAVVAARGVKPAQLAVAAGDNSATTRWLAAAAVNAVLVYGSFWLMHARPF